MESPLTTKGVILQVLLNGPAYGAQIMASVKAATKKRLVLHSGSVYPALVSLEKDGLVKEEMVDDDLESGRSCYYSLTEAGKVEARRQRSVVRIVFFSQKKKKWRSPKRSSSSISMAS